LGWAGNKLLALWVNCFVGFCGHLFYYPETKAKSLGAIRKELGEIRLSPPIKKCILEYIIRLYPLLKRFHLVVEKSLFGKIVDKKKTVRTV